MKTLKVCFLDKVYPASPGSVIAVLAPAGEKIVQAARAPTLDGPGLLCVSKHALAEAGISFDEASLKVDHVAVLVTDDPEGDPLTRCTFYGIFRNSREKSSGPPGLIDLSGPDEIEAAFSSLKFYRPPYGDDVLAYIKANVPVLLVGPAGCGKTALAYNLAAECGKEVLRVNFDGGMTPESFMGGLRVRAAGAGGELRQETWFQEGPVLEAAKTGAWLVLDECDRAAPEYMTALHSLVENTRNIITVNDDGGRRVVPHRDFRIIATANTLGSGSDAGLGYYGSSPMNLSFKDRFAIFRVDYPEAAEEKIIETVFGGDLDAGKKTADLFRLLRKSAASGKMAGYAFSTRRLIGFLKACCLFKDPDKAFAYEIAARLDREDENLANVIFSDVFGHIPGLAS
jgi:cobaltochelatase CobS